MAWTKASVDSGEHTYSEALMLMNAAGYTKAELDEFLAYNPGDLYRVPEAFDLSTGGVDPLSTGQVARDPIPPTAISSVSAGSTGSLFITSPDTAVIPSSSQPAREAAAVYGAGPAATVPGFLSTFGIGGADGRGIPWLLLAAVAVGVWYLAKRS